MPSRNRRLFIIGAGYAGRTLAAESRRKAVFGEITAFLDDDKDLIGQTIEGVPVLGPIHKVEELLPDITGGDEAIIALPGVCGDYLKEIYNLLKAAGFENIRILPSLSQIIDGNAHLIQTRSINPQDLLGRTPLTIDLKSSIAYLKGKRVLVTGAGGSIGSEICRQLLEGSLERLYLLGHGENAIYNIDKELRLLQEEGVGEKATIVPIIGDIKDRDYVNYIVRQLKADAVFHTAAYKHVPMMEENPVAAIENNLFGTENVLKAAKNYNVKRFVFITTDKAVDPVSIYGASKHLAEKLVLEEAATARADQHFMVVRFGNVLGSSGSILPLFQKQIEKGGPLTVTDPEVSRWFMTIPEACSLVLRVGGIGLNKDLYLLDMGDPIKIKDMAEQMIRFYGYEPDVDIKIEYIGLRPGERLKESLWGKNEVPVHTKLERILKVENKFASGITLRLNGEEKDENAEPSRLEQLLERLRPVCRLQAGSEMLFHNSKHLLSILYEELPSLSEPE